MTGDMEHLILTRFNLAMKFRCDRRFDSDVPIEKPWLNTEYLGKRFDIFEKYTFPSFENQKNKEFKWIVMFHADTPSDFKERIDGLESRMEQFIPVFLTDNECKKNRKWLQEYIHKNYEGKKIITTRMDNDDAVHDTFVEHIQRDILDSKMTNNTVLTYSNGLQYDSRTEIALKYPYVNNHFLTLYVTGTKGNNHILFYNHSTINEYVEEGQIRILEKHTDIPLWVEIITESNYSNRLKYHLSSVGVSDRLKYEYPLLRFR